MSTPRRRRAPARSKPRRQQATGRDFWGSDGPGEDPAPPIRPLDDPTALISSLGAPPLGSREMAAEYQLAMVYSKAAAMATALAAASGLLFVEERDDEHK